MSQKSREKEDLELILNSLEDYILVISPDGIIEREFRSNLESPLFNTLISKIDSHYTEVFPKKLADLVSNSLKICIESEETNSFDYEVDDSDERWWYNIRINTIKQGVDQLKGFSIFIRDITPRKKAEETYRLIFENAVMGIYQSTDDEGIHLSANPALAEIYGYDNVDDLFNGVKNISKELFVDPLRRKKLLEILNEKGECRNFESQVYKKNGEIIWISENARVVRDDNDRIMFIVGTVKDITERKLTEEKLFKAKEDWERTFDSLDEIITILDKDLNIVRMNKAAKNKLNVAKQSSQKDKCKDILKCNEENCKNCSAYLTLSTGKVQVGEVENPTLGKTFLISTSPKLDESGDISGVVFVAKDITEEKRLRQESEYRLQQIIQSDKLKSLGEMVASVAHEINNPNSFIFYNAALLEDSWRKFKPYLDEKISEINNREVDTTTYAEMIAEMGDIIDSIKIGSKRISNVVNNVKDFARIEDGTKKVEVDINLVIDKAYEIIGAKIRRHVASYKITKAENLPLVLGHFQKLEQVVINLIDNALQSIAERNNSLLKITTMYIKRLNAVLLEIEDNGRGIKRENLAKIFEPFFTTRRDIGGTGLGLSVSYEIINRHEGRIAVLSKELIGTKFTIYLPMNNQLPELQPKILCADQGLDIYNMMRIAFIEETDKFISTITEPANIMQYLYDHPEVDVLVLNMNIGTLGWKIIERIKSSYPLTELVLYSDELDLESEVRERAIKDAKIINGPLQIDKLREILNLIVRQKL